MSLVNAKFPLYAIRTYIEFKDEPPYKIIVTKYGEYVLDYLDKHETYAARRLSLLTAGSGYKLYPLKERFENVASVINSKHRTFIDAEGRIVKKGGENRKFYKCHHDKVLHYERAYDGNFRLFTREHIFIAQNLCNYVEYINIGGGVVLLNVMDSLDNARSRVLI